MSVGAFRYLAKRSASRGSYAQQWMIAVVAAAALLMGGCASDASSVSGLLSIAGRQAAASRCSEAIATYTQVLGVSPGNLVALAGRGSCYGQLGEYAQAIADYTAITHVTASATDLVTLATYEWDAGYTSQATSDVATASRLAGQGDSVGELLNIAGVQMEYSAIADASITLGRIPISGRLSQWYLLSGTVAGDMFNVPAMTKDLAVAVHLAPTSQLAPTLVVAANSWWGLGYYQTAITLYQRALTSEGSIDRGQVYVQMGYAYDRMGQPQAALGEYRAALGQGLSGSAQQGTEYAIAADFAGLRQVLQARAALAPLLRASLTPALRAEVDTLEATLTKGG